MSTPRYVNQAGSAIQTSPSGSPEAKDWIATAPSRLDVTAARRLCRVPTRRGLSSEPLDIGS